MPKAVHEALKKEAHKKGLTGEAFDRYVYGGLANWEKKYGKKHKSKVAKPGN